MTHTIRFCKKNILLYFYVCCNIIGKRNKIRHSKFLVVGPCAQRTFQLSSYTPQIPFNVLSRTRLFFCNHLIHYLLHKPILYLIHIIFFIEYLLKGLNIHFFILQTIPHTILFLLITFPVKLSLKGCA